MPAHPPSASALLGLALTTLVFGLAVTSASATVMLPLSVEDLTRQSDFVARGRVLSADPFRAEVNGRAGIYTHVQLRVDEWLAGDGPANVGFLVHGGRINREAMFVHGQAAFVPGEDVVVFLYRGGEAIWPTGMSQGKWSVARGPRGTSVVTSGADPTAFLGHSDDPPVAGSLALEELRARVRAAAGAR